MLVRRWEGSFDRDSSKVRNLSYDKFFKQCDRVGKTKKNYTCCNLALKPVLEFLNQIKCNRNQVTEEHRR